MSNYPFGYPSTFQPSVGPYSLVIVQPNGIGKLLFFRVFMCLVIYWCRLTHAPLLLSCLSQPVHFGRCPKMCLGPIPYHGLQPIEHLCLALVTGASLAFGIGPREVSSPPAYHPRAAGSRRGVERVLGVKGGLPCARACLSPKHHF